MWQQNYTPIGNSLALSALIAAVPIFVLLFLIGIKRKPAWMASLAGLAVTLLLAGVVYRMPFGMLFSSIFYGAAFGLFPIGWVVFSAILLYRVTVESGRFGMLKDSVGHLTDDGRLQMMLVAFAFGAFIEGCAGFGTPVAVAATMLIGLGFSPFMSAAVCLLANTAPVAFGSIAVPITTLAVTTGLPIERLSAGVGRICAPISLFIPAYMIAVMCGWSGLRGVLPAAAVCGAAFAATQFFVSNFIGPQLTDILASMAAIGALIVLFRFWKPRDKFDFGHLPPSKVVHSKREMLLAWSPYILLVIMVLLWGYPPIQRQLNSVNIPIQWPGLHNLVQRMPPVVEQASGYGAVFNLNWLSAAGTSCLFAAILASFVVGLSPAQFAKAFKDTCKQLVLAELTLAAVLALAFVMNYSGATGTLGLAFAATGVLFPMFSAVLGSLGVFLTGSDTSANALFGTLQEVTANKLGMNAVLMASGNSAGGVMGKMISLTSIAVAAAATQMKREDEGRLFGFTLKHSIFLTLMIGLVVMFYAYVAPSWAP
ncbi:MAG TPA: L-lactate permease [Terriglobia bacterium]|nr:L-lactate permease [Terriglobia bacterium]